MKETKNVYLLPLFLKNMAFCLGFRTDTLSEEMEKRISTELEDVHKKISEEIKHISPKKMKDKEIIQGLYKQFEKVQSQNVGKQIKVLFLLRKLLSDLKHWNHLSNNDLKQLKKMLDAGDLFFGSYNTGVDSKTIERLLSEGKKNPPVNDKKIKLLFEVFVEQLKMQNIRDIFFNRYFSDLDRVRSAFFACRGGEVVFDNVDNLVNDIMELKRIPFDSFLTKLEYICKSLEFIQQAQVIPCAEQVVEPIKEDEENAVYEAQQKDFYYADFHSMAMNFLKRDIALKIEMGERDAVRDLYSIVEDAWCVFSRMCHKDIAMGTKVKELPFQELVIHSLHNNQKFHLQLCSSFKNWKEGDAL